MPKRMIDTELWNNDDIIENFTAEDRYFWLYLLTSPHNNICGVFKNSPSLMARDMGLHKDTIINLLYRFDNIHNLIYVDKETNEILILNWYKFNWTTSPKILSLLQKEQKNIKSDKINELLNERIKSLFDDTVLIGYPYPSISNTNTISTTNSDSDIVSTEKIDEYFDKTYKIYPRKADRKQAKITFEHMLRGLNNEEAKSKAIKIYRFLEQQISIWKEENKGQGRKTEYMPYFSSWLNDNIEESPHFKRKRKC